MRTSPSRGSGGIEIKIRAEAEKATSGLRLIGEELDSVRKRAAESTASVTNLSKSIAVFSSGAVIAGVTKTASAIGSISSAIKGIYDVSQIPLVSAQLNELYKAGLESTQEIASLSSILKSTGELSSSLGENFLTKGVFSDLGAKIAPLRDSVAKVFDSGLTDFSKKITSQVGGQINRIQKAFGSQQSQSAQSGVGAIAPPQTQEPPDLGAEETRETPPQKSNIADRLRESSEKLVASVQVFTRSSTARISLLTRDASRRITASLETIGDRIPQVLKGRIDFLRSVFTKSSADLRKFSEPFFKGLRSALSPQALVATGNNLLSSARDRLSDLRGTLLGGGGSGGQLLPAAKNGMDAVTSAISRLVPGQAQSGIEALRSRISGAAKEAASIINEAWQDLPRRVESLSKSVPEKIQSQFIGVKGRITDGLEIVSAALKATGANILKVIQSLASNFPQELQKRLSSLKDFAESGIAAARKLFSGTSKELEQPALPVAPDEDLANSLTTRNAKGDISPTRVIGDRVKISTAPIEEYKQKFLGAIDEIDRRIITTAKTLENLPKNVEMAGQLIAGSAGAIAGLNQSKEIFEDLKGIVGGASEAIGEASQQVFFFTSALDSLQGLVANGPYQMLVGQNVELRKQLLETQSSIVATNKVLRDGVQITDPTAAIQALDAPVNAAIAKIRRDSLELVGVTSKDLVGVFNIINQSASQANISLAQSADLTSSFAAALGTIGLPLDQARQEINSILTAQIDQNSTLAKTLSLDNDRVRQLAQQGKLYDYLTERLGAFRAGNALAAKTIEGVGSNIQEVFDGIALEAGAQLIDPIVEQLTRFYEALNANKTFLVEYVSGLVSGLKDVGLAISSIIEAFGKNLGGIALQIPQYLFKELASGAKSVAEAIDFAFAIFRPFFELIGAAAQFIVPSLASPFFKLAISAKVLVTVFTSVHRALGLLVQMLPGAGQLFALLTVRTNPLIQQFANLAEGTGNFRIALGLLLGKELTNIPGAMAAITGKMGIFGGMIAPLIPQVSQFAIAMVGLNKQFGITDRIPVDKIFGEVSGVISGGLLPSLSKLASDRGLTTLSGQIDDFAGKVSGISGVGALGDAVAGKVGDALGIDTTTTKVAALQGAITGVNDVLATKLLPGFAKVAKFAGFQKIADQATGLADNILETASKAQELSKFDKVVDGVTQNIGKSVAKSAVSMGLWAAGITVAVVALAELWKRSEDAGDQVVKLTKNITQTAELIRSTWDETRASTNKPLIDENAIPATDWIDSIILKMREFEKSPIEALKKANNFKDGLILLGQVIVQIFSGAYKVVETAVRSIVAVISTLINTVQLVVEAVVAGWNVIQTIFKNPLDFSAIQGAFDNFGDTISNSLNRFADKNAVVIDDVFEPWRYGFRDLETKGEESFRELGNALDKGGLGKSVEEVTAALDGLEKEIENATGGAGALFSEELAPVSTAIANLKNGTGSIKDVKDAIASVSQQFPSLAKDLEGVSAQLSTEFPGDALAASKSIDQLAEGIVKLNNDGKPGLEGIAMAIDKFKAGKGSIGEVKGEIEKYKATLTSLDDKKQIESLAAPIDALERSITSLDGNASNKKIADFSAALAKNIEEAQALLKEAEKGGAGSAEASAARERLAGLEAQRDRLDKFTESVKVLGDPFLKLQNQLGAAKESIEKTTTDISNAQKEATARIRTAAASGVDIDTGEEKLVTDSQARILTLQQETQSIEEEIPVRYEAVKKLREIYDAMTPEEKERSKDLKRQLDSEQAALYEAAANGAEKRAELEKAIADKAISDIDRANKLALEKSEKAESDRLVMLTQMRNQGLITAEQFEQQKADAGIKSAKTELDEQRKLVKKLEALPKPSDPDEARDREDRIRAEKLKTSQLTLKLLEAENAAYEAQTRQILAELERQSDMKRAALERAGRSGAITDSEKGEQEAALEVRRIRAELARERDANKRAELQLQLEKAKTSKTEATRRRQQDEFDRAQADAEAALERSGRSGAITDSEKAEREAAIEIRRVRAELLRERDANKRAELQLQLEKAKTSKAEATRRRQQDEFDRAQTEAEAEQLRAQREGGADAEKAYAAALERRLAAARRGVEVAEDANEKAKANLELQKVLNDIEVDRIDRNLKAIENSYKRQNQALQKQTSLLDLAEKSLSKQRELIDSANQLRQSVSDYYDQTLGVIGSLEKSDYRRRQLAEVTATIKLQAAIQEVKIAEQTLAIEQQMKRLALEREKIQARIAENEKLGNIKRLEAEEQKAKLRGASPEEIEAIRIEKDAAVQDYELSKENTRLVNEQAAAQEQIFEMQRRVQDIQGKGKIEAAAGNLIQNMADPVNRYNAGEQYKEYLARQLGASNYQNLREGGLQGARDFQEQFFGQGMSRQGLMRGQSFDISQAIADRQNQAFSGTLPGAASRPALPAASAPTIALPQPQLFSLDAIASNVAAMKEALGATSGSSAGRGVTVTIQDLNIKGDVQGNGGVTPEFAVNFRRELEKVFNEAGRLSAASST